MSSFLPYLLLRKQAENTACGYSRGQQAKRAIYESFHIVFIVTSGTDFVNPYSADSRLKIKGTVEKGHPANSVPGCLVFYFLQITFSSGISFTQPLPGQRSRESLCPFLRLHTEPHIHKVPFHDRDLIIRAEGPYLL